jgi:hypothetical protein
MGNFYFFIFFSSVRSFGRALGPFGPLGLTLTPKNDKNEKINYTEIHARAREGRTESFLQTFWGTFHFWTLSIFQNRPLSGPKNFPSFLPTFLLSILP